MERRIPTDQPRGGKPSSGLKKKQFQSQHTVPAKRPTRHDGSFFPFQVVIMMLELCCDPIQESFFNSRIGVIVQVCEVTPAMLDGGLASKFLKNPHKAPIMKRKPHLGVLPHRLDDFNLVLR